MCAITLTCFLKIAFLNMPKLFIHNYSSIAPVTTNIVLANGNNFAVGSVLLLQCDVKGFPKPTVAWFKDNVQLEPNDRTQITGKY